MDQLSEKQQDDIKKMSTARLQFKLIRTGYSEEQVESFDRQTCIEKWAELVAAHVEHPVPTALQSTVVDVEFERERLKWEQEKFSHELKLRDDELRLRDRELALKEQELQMTAKMKEDEIELQRQKIKEESRRENSLAMKTKRFSDALKGSLIKMSVDPIEIASFFRQVDSLFDKFEIPIELRATLVKPYLNDKAKFITSRLDPTVADDYEALKAAIMREFKTTPSYLLNKFKTLCKDPSETFILYSSKLMTVIKYYIESRKVGTDFDKMLELLVCDRIKATLDGPCLKHVLTLENSATDGWLPLNDLATAIDKFYANCVGNWEKSSPTSQIQATKRDNQLPPRGMPLSHFRARGRESFNHAHSRPQADTVRRCHKCNSPDHLRAACPQGRSSGQGAVTSSSAQSASTSQGPTPVRRARSEYRQIDNPHITNTVMGGSETKADVNRVNVNNTAMKFEEYMCCDLPHVDVVLSDEAGRTTDTVRAIVDSGSETCVVREDVIAKLDCLTVGKVTLRGIIGEPFEAHVKRVYISSATGDNTIIPIVCASHELVHDELLLTPAVVELLLSSQGLGSQNSPSDTSHVGELTTESHTNDLSVNSVGLEQESVDVNTVMEPTGPSTIVEPDTLMFTDILPTQATSCETEHLSREQKQDESLAQWWQLAQENKNGFFVENNLLFRTERILGHSFKQLCVPQPRRELVLDLAHNVVGTHMGIKRTRERILFSFTWPGLRADVRNYVRTCPMCQKRARITYQDKVPIKAIKLDARPFRVWFIDILGPLFQDNTEMKYAVVMVDSATKFPFAKAIRAPSAKNVCDAILEVWQFTGVGEILISDNGTHFTSQLNQEFLTRLGCTPRFITPNHPSANGLCERMVGTIKNMLSKVAMENPKSWHKHLGFILWSLREVSNESTGVPPWVLAFGHLPRGPLAILQESWCDNQQLPAHLGKAPHAYLMELRDNLERAQEYANQHAQAAQQKYVQRYNLRACEKSFIPGEKVLILKRNTTASKTFSSWIGPGEVVEVRSPSSYLVEIDGAQRIYHVNDLRKYHIRVSRAVCDTLCIGVSHVVQVDTCAVIYDRDNDFGQVHFVEPMSDVAAETTKVTELLPSQKLAPEALCHLSEHKQKQLLEVLDKYPQCFSDVPGYTEEVEHCIPIMPGFVPKRLRAYKVPEKLKHEVDKQIHDMLKQGIIEPSQSPMASPLVCILKGPEGRDGVRLAVDFRYVNKYTLADAFPVPDMADVKQRIGGKCWITLVDAKSGYWQTPVRSEDRWLTAFVYNDGLYQFCRTPFGLRSSGSTFIRAIKKILQPINAFTDSYVDDMAAFSDRWHQHLIHLDHFLMTLSNANITLNLKKCSFAQSQVLFCGEILGSGIRKVDPEKIEAVQKIRVPHNKTQLRQILGLFSFFREFIPKFAEIAQPLTELTKRGVPNEIPWTPTHQQALDQLKQLLIEATDLTVVNFEQPFDIFLDASEKSVGGTLTQQKTAKQYAPVAFFSQKLTDSQRKWSTIEREAFAVIVGLRKYRSWLFQTEICVHSDHNPLVYLTDAAPKSARLMRWALALQEFQIKFEYRRGRDNAAADCLSRLSQD